MSEYYPNPIVMKLEEAIPLLMEGEIDIVIYQKFYDKEFTNTDMLQKGWPKVESCLREHGVLCTLDLVEGKLEVSKTKGAEDEDIIYRAIDILQLLCRSVPASWALQTLDCSCDYEIIKTGNQEGGLCKLYGINKEQFLARRNLLIGIVKELAALTGCGIFLKGNTVAVIGSPQEIKMITKIVVDCIAHDVHPGPRVRRIRKKTQPKKDERIKMTSEVMMRLESLCV